MNLRINIAVLLMVLLGFFLPSKFFAQWSSDPGVNNQICTAVNEQTTPKIVTDGAGGAIITWSDRRGGVAYDIYAQRIDVAGVLQWMSDGVAISLAASEQSDPVIVSDGAGGAIIAWRDSRGTSGDIYAQRVNNSGVVQWTQDGVPICTAPFSQDYPVIVSDGAGGAIIAWEDYRSGTNQDIYAQRVNSAGITQWTADGVPISTASNWVYSPAIVSDNAGGAIIAWRDYRSSDDIYAQRINNAGVVQWTTDGVPICTAANDQVQPAIVSDGAAGAIITWQDHRNLTNPDIYAQRVSSAGVVQWTANGVAVSTAVNSQENPIVVSDGSGGAIIVWQDYRAGTSYTDVYANRVNASGQIQWTTDGVSICTAMWSQRFPTTIEDGSGGAIVTWYDGRNGSNMDIYAQRISFSGGVQWTADGTAICTAAGGQDSPTITSYGAGGAVITWRDVRSNIADIYAQNINADGTLGSTSPAITVTSPNGGKLGA